MTLPLAAASLALPQAARANDPCSTVGTTATCTGDQSSGVSYTTGTVNTVNVQLLTLPIQPAATVPGIALQQAGADGVAFGQSGSAGDALTVNADGTVVIATQGAAAHGISVISTGGNGMFGFAMGENGGNGGNGGDISVTSSAQIGGSGAGSAGIFASTAGGAGAAALFGTFGAAGNGGNISINNTGAITMTGAGSLGIFATSTSGGSLIGGASGSGGTVSVINSGAISTGATGGSAHGIFARSLGLAGGNGASGSGISASGQGGGVGQNAGAVSIGNSGAIITSADNSHGLYALSQAGNGGNGGSAGGASASGGGGGAGGSAGIITVTNSGVISVTGAASYGIYAASFGADGGTGGNATALIDANGGAGGTGGAAGNVTVTTNAVSNITTAGDAGHGIYAISRGGGGGGAGNAGAIYGAGGGAGGGGTSGIVTVNMSGTIVTSGLGSYGILAESTGGGGGSGAGGSGIVGIGSGGGAASPGGIVNVTVNGLISTTGDLSHAVVASSIGGGGGAGGGSGGLVSIGGGGSSSGSADHVTVINNGALLTQGAGAYGVFAQSVGGGGGNGGNSDGWIAIGGSGGGGGNGGLVDVTNTSFIKTTGLYSHGIYAQSVSGGGGDGGYGSSIGGFLGTTVSIGGTGGAGGFGSAVHVTNTGTIIVTGYRAAAIYAQSVGGGGGNGGDATSIGATPISVAIGGGGGNGGAGGTVTVDNTGLLATQGDRSSAIHAQSVGGGGGTGGAGFAVSANVVAIAVAVGGYGGDGGNADTVTVNQNGAILTAGSNSYGIFAQSVGGGGGDGGAAAALAVSASPKQSAAVAVAVGGSGGIAGEGGAVNVTNTGSIVTIGAGATGVLGQSVGGGGGNGGSADSTAVVFFAAKQNLAAAVSVGGSGGAAGNGGAVVINNTGRIMTVGDDAHGIQAQSVGGGGGNGGAGRATAMAASLDINIKDYADKVIAIVNGATRNDTIPETPDVPFPDLPDTKDKKKADDTKKDKEKEKGGSQSVSLSVGVGGTGGASGNGGTVTVNNVGRIDTYGFMSYGIFAQSVGGGGGEGGGGSSAAGAGSTLNVGGGFGGGGGSAGNGGVVTVTNTGIIATRGHDAIGIVAQSIGGGGGVGGAGDANAGLDVNSIAVSVGGQGGSAATDFGGHVIVQQNGDIVTVGDRAHGILAQSVGAGGGLGGVGVAGNAGTIFVGGAGGGAAAGGQVDVTMTGNITTSGISAHGVLAQSVGGGGGIGGDLSGSILTIGVGVGGFAGNGGDGGIVNTTTTGTIVTQGMRSFGILAQSIGGGGGLGGQGEGAPLSFSFAGSNGGAGAGGAINITHTGSVLAFGEGSHAIFAQSTGGNGGGNIAIALQGGLVNGGTGDAAGVYIDGGATNTLTLATGATLSALSGLAIKATGGGNNTVNNSGTVLGNVDMTAAFNAFNNLANGTFVTKTDVNLAGGLLSNAGWLDLGGYKTVVTTTLTGNLAQSTAGTLAVDVRFGGGASDLLNVTGTADVRGFVKPTTLSLVPNAPVTILTAGGGFTGTNDATAVGTPIITYGLQYVGNNLQVNVQNVNFVPAAFAGGMTQNEKNVANHLQGVWNTGVASNLANAMGYLVNFTNLAGYAATLDQLLPAPYLAQQTGAMMAGLGFLDGMMSCRGAGGPLAALREYECTWARFAGNSTTQQSNADTFGYRETAESYQAGVQTQVQPGWFHGLAASFQTARATIGTVANTTAQRLDVGMSVKHQVGNWLFAGAIDLGVASTDTKRYIGFAGVTADSRSAVWHVDTRLRAAYLFEAGHAYLKPSVDLDLIYLNMPSFSENGAGPLNLNVNSMSKTVGVITPAVEFGTTLRDSVATAEVRHFVSGGVSWFSDKTWSVSSTFDGTPVGVGSFVTSTAFPDTIYKLSTGIDFLNKRPSGGVDLRFVYDGQFAGGYQSHSGSVKASMRF